MNARRDTEGRIRIIGGVWRGRKLAVAPRQQLRPSPDRIRETVFNWLGPYLPGAACLDLFAGTGVLGFEAVSRGAAHATLVDKDPLIVDYLHRHRTALAAEDTVSIVQRDALAWLADTPPIPFDIVFLDPPFAQGLLLEALHGLGRGWLKAHALVYLEAEKLPVSGLQEAGWRLLRQGHTRQINFALAEPSEPALV